jgi:hypothetical protein
MKLLSIAAMFIAISVLLGLPAAADKGKLSDSDRAEILALTEKVETAIINKDLELLQECCDPWDGLWIDAGFGAGWETPSPIIYYGWEQIPSLLRDNHLYFLGNADGSGSPVYGRAPEIIWQGRWQIREVNEPSGAGSSRAFPFIMRRTSLADIMQANDGREVDTLTYPPANVVFYWEDKYHYVQYFHVGAQEPYDNDFWFLLFNRDPNRRQSQREWCLSGIAHLDGWGI